MNYSYRPLFGHVSLSIQEFFSSFKLKNESIPVTCIMGSPSAAFRAIFPPQSGINADNPQSVNGQVRMPLINFIAVDHRRVYGEENPYARVNNGVRRIDSFGKEYTQIEYDPQVWVISFQFSVWTNTYKQRDDLMSRILTTFRHECALKWFHDPVEKPNDFIYLELRMDDNFQDDTNLEDLNERESRKAIRTSFSVTCRTILPYDTEEVPLIKTVQVTNKGLENRGSSVRFDVIKVEGEDVVVINQFPPLPVVF